MDFFRKSQKIAPAAYMEPIPVGEVQESSWADWEDSVAFQDSQMGDFRETDRLALMPELDTPADPFAAVTRKDK